MRSSANRYSPGEARLLLVASTGGHLEQLNLWRKSWSINKPREVTWATFSSPQSESLLEGEKVYYVPYIAPRDWLATIKAVPALSRLIRSQRPERIISTGAAVALSALLVAKALRIPFTYIESLARVSEPSMTARIVSYVPGVTRLVQHPELVRPGWTFEGSVFDTFEVSRVQATPSSSGISILVTVGTIKPYGFDRLIRSIESVTTENDQVVFQTGSSRHTPSIGAAHTSMSRSSLIDAIKAADVIVSHAGVGSILSCLQAGKIPIVCPRLRAFDEHIDDHQRDIAVFSSKLGLSQTIEADQVTRGALLQMMSLRCIQR